MKNVFWMLLVFLNLITISRAEFENKQVFKNDIKIQKLDSVINFRSDINTIQKFVYDNHGNNILRIHDNYDKVDKTKSKTIGSKTERVFDKKSRLTLLIDYNYFNYSPNIWNPNRQLVYKYDDNDSLIEHSALFKTYDQRLLWDDGFKYEYIYNENKKLITYNKLGYDEDKQEYYLLAKVENSYDNKNNLILKMQYQRNNEKDSVFRILKYEYEFDSKNNVILYKKSNWDKTLNEWVVEDQTKYTYTYNKNQITEKIIFTFDKTIMDVRPYYKIQYELDSLLNKYQTIDFYWQQVNSIYDWLPSGKKEIYKNIFGYDTLFIDYGYNIKDNIWFALKRNFTKFNEKNKIINITETTFDKNQQKWQTNSIIKYNYDDKNQLIFESRFDNNYDNYLIGTYQNEFLYDLKGNLLHIINLNDWNTNRNNWTTGKKNEYSYNSNGDTLIKTYYDWDIVINNWIASTQEENIYMQTDTGYTLTTLNKWWDTKNKIFKINIYTNKEFDKDNNLLSSIFSFAESNYVTEIEVNRYQGMKTNKSVYTYDTNILATQLFLPNESGFKINSITNNKLIKIEYYNFDTLNKTFKYYDKAEFYYSPIIETSVENEILTNPDFLIFPNPSSEKITLDLGGVAVADLVIYDILGNEIMSIPNYTNKAEIDIRNLSIGTYTIQVQTGTGSISQRLLVNR